MTSWTGMFTWLCVVGVLALVVLPQTAEGQAKTWVVSGPAAWGDNANWDPNAPGDNDGAIINNGGTATLTGATGVAVSLWVGQASTQGGTILIGTGGTLGNGGLTAIVGVGGYGHIEQTAGHLHMSDLYLGADDGSTGTYSIQDATAMCPILDIGCDGYGAMVSTRGTVTVTELYLGGDKSDYDDTTGHGEFTMIGGTQNGVEVGLLSVTRKLRLGCKSYGALTQNGGSANIAVLHMGGHAPGATGEYSMSSGTLVLPSYPYELEGALIVGEYGTGHFVQTGGSVDVGPGFLLASAASGTGHYQLAGGTLVQTSGTVVVGDLGIGTVELNGGTFDGKQHDHRSPDRFDWNASGFPRSYRWAERRAGDGGIGKSDAAFPDGPTDRRSLSHGRHRCHRPERC